jgi:thiol-disulfide isomerase/thioredoxin
MVGMIKEFCKSVYQDKLKLTVTVIIALVVVGLLILPQRKEMNGNGVELHFFYSPTCPHCAEQKLFNQELVEKYAVRIVGHDVTRPNEAKLFVAEAEKHNIPLNDLGVPLTIVNGQVFLGFDSAETTGSAIEAAVRKSVEGTAVPKRIVSETRKFPFLGEFNVAKYSLPALAVILGLVDGFNPCAMWALVFLIGLVIGLRDYRKLWLLVGSFVAASGILYFLFMTAWLNVFLFIGFMRPVVVIIGGLALWLGINQVRDFFVKELVCPLPSDQKRRVMHRMEKLVFSPMTLATVFGIILLAFVINSIEFICSSFIPAVFTQTLALYNLPAWQYYGYILLYDFFFMLDDLIIFSLAVFAVTHVGDKYAKWCKLIGGVILFALGIILLFFPHLLR